MDWTDTRTKTKAVTHVVNIVFTWKNPAEQRLMRECAVEYMLNNGLHFSVHADEHSSEDVLADAPARWSGD